MSKILVSKYLAIVDFFLLEGHFIVRHIFVARLFSVPTIPRPHLSAIFLQKGGERVKVSPGKVPPST